MLISIELIKASICRCEIESDYFQLLRIIKCWLGGFSWTVSYRFTYVHGTCWPWFIDQLQCTAQLLGYLSTKYLFYRVFQPFAVRPPVSRHEWRESALTQWLTFEYSAEYRWVPESSTKYLESRTWEYFLTSIDLTVNSFSRDYCSFLTLRYPEP